MNELNLTPVEQKVLDFVVSRNNNTIYWEELVQFAKDPQNASRKTALKWVSEIKRKYETANKLLPFNVTFDSLANKKDALASPTTIGETIVHKLSDGQVQTLVKVQKTPVVPPVPQTHIDFVLDRSMRRVRTKNGFHQLNESEWEVFKYLHSNVGKIIPISELRDKVVFPQYGSKLPARWFDAIMRIINNMRRQVVGLESRLLTVKSTETSYLFQ